MTTHDHFCAHKIDFLLQNILEKLANDHFYATSISDTKNYLINNFEQDIQHELFKIHLQGTKIVT